MTKIVELAERPPRCKYCRTINGEDIKTGQIIALYFDTATFTRRKGNGSEAGIMGAVKSIQKDENQKIYSIKIENTTLTEIIMSSIQEVITVCSECAKKIQ